MVKIVIASGQYALDESVLDARKKDNLVNLINRSYTKICIRKCDTNTVDLCLYSRKSDRIKRSRSITRFFLT